MPSFKKGDVVFHKKAYFIGYVADDDPGVFSVATPNGVVENLNPKKFVKLAKALDQGHPLREEALQAVLCLPVGSVGFDSSGDLWTKTEDGWGAAQYTALTFYAWFADPSVKVYPAIPKKGYISKKEASCVES